MVVAKVGKRLAENKQAAQKFDVDRSNLRKLSDMQDRKQYHIKISKIFAAFEKF